MRGLNERAQAILLLAFAAILIRLGLTDAALPFVRPGLRPALLAAGIVLAVLGAHALRRDLRPAAGDPEAAGHDHAPGVAWLLALPLLTLLLVAPSPLGSFAAGRQGSEPPALMSGIDFAGLPEPRDGAVDLSMREYVGRALYDEATSLADTRVRLVGFVAPLDDDAAGGYLLTRFAVNCCAADATALSVEVVGDGARPVDTWLEIEGRWEPRDGHEPGTADTEPPLFVAERVTPIDQPAEPYEY
ncbi:TIGR03943 family putative permease subunit [Jiangella anatolica]|uniref:TIGR03943 family putative permease subunit n=1 Tax=Jiangella anatolica TaxID=2670374 RepID=UPI001313F278|nr:TIGR03943 family protein [Jiangella anatolica]